MKNSIELKNEIIKYFMGEGKDSEEATIALIEFDSNVWTYLYERKRLIMEHKSSFIEELVQERKETVKNNLKKSGIQDLLLEYKEKQLEEVIKEWNSEKMFKKGGHYTYVANAVNKDYINSCNYLSINNQTLEIGYKVEPVYYLLCWTDFSKISNECLGIFGKMKDFDKESLNEVLDCLKMELDLFKELKKEIEVEK